MKLCRARQLYFAAIFNKIECGSREINRTCGLDLAELFVRVRANPAADSLFEPSRIYRRSRDIKATTRLTEHQFKSYERRVSGASTTQPPCVNARQSRAGARQGRAGRVASSARSLPLPRLSAQSGPISNSTAAPFDPAEQISFVPALTKKTVTPGSIVSKLRLSQNDRAAALDHIATVVLGRPSTFRQNTMSARNCQSFPRTVIPASPKPRIVPKSGPLPVTAVSTTGVSVVPIIMMAAMPRRTARWDGRMLAVALISTHDTADKKDKARKVTPLPAAPLTPFAEGAVMNLPYNSGPISERYRCAIWVKFAEIHAVGASNAGNQGAAGVKGVTRHGGVNVLNEIISDFNHSPQCIATTVMNRDPHIPLALKVGAITAQHSDGSLSGIFQMGTYYQRKGMNEGVGTFGVQSQIRQSASNSCASHISISTQTITLLTGAMLNRSCAPSALSSRRSKENYEGASLDHPQNGQGVHMSIGPDCTQSGVDSR
ncbi:hypothetical protein DFH06DRAFT_1148135 [Mycena polygramma]|nr:hypothetical protein DFH06DRAFT_1148135 [Mycena polygramma]